MLPMGNITYKLHTLKRLCQKINKISYQLPGFIIIKGMVDYKKRFLLYILDKKCSKQNMKNTFRKNVFVCEDFLSTVKKMSCIKKRFSRGLQKMLLLQF